MFVLNSQQKPKQMENITPYIITAIVIIALLFLFRAILLWYWKVNETIRNQEILINCAQKQSNILEKMLIQLGGNMENEAMPSLADDKSDEVAELERLKEKIKPGQVIVKVKCNERLEVLSWANWAEIEILGNQDKFEILHKEQ